MIRALIALILMAGLALAIIYFLPAGAKIKALEKIVTLAPDSLKEKVENIAFTPPEQRIKLINQLENNLARLKTAPPAEHEFIVAESENLLTKLQEKNDDASLIQILENKLADKLLNIEKATTSACVN